MRARLYPCTRRHHIMSRMAYSIKYNAAAHTSFKKRGQAPHGLEPAQHAVSGERRPHVVHVVRGLACRSGVMAMHKRAGTPPMPGLPHKLYPDMRASSKKNSRKVKNFPSRLGEQCAATPIPHDIYMTNRPSPSVLWHFAEGCAVRRRLEMRCWSLLFVMRHYHAYPLAVVPAARKYA